MFSLNKTHGLLKLQQAALRPVATNVMSQVDIHW